MAAELCGGGFVLTNWTVYGQQRFHLGVYVFAADDVCLMWAEVPAREVADRLRFLGAALDMTWRRNYLVVF